MKSIHSCLLALLFLTSCANFERYPQEWANLEEQNLRGKCPVISGVYVEYGWVVKSCHDKAEPCYLLSYAFLSGGVSYKEAFEGGDYQWSKSQAKVRLDQPDERTLDISTMDSEGNVVRQETLSMDKGDFYCDNGRLVLKGRPIVYLVGISNMVGNISRRFSRSSDGALVMESKRSVIMHMTIFPLAGTDTYWVQWAPIQ